MMKKYQVLCGFMIFLLTPGIGVTAQLCPCTVIAYANANTYIQSPSYSQYIPFDSPLTFTDCSTTTAATIVIANPPESPPPTAPVYMTLANSAAGPFTSSVLLVQGSTVITKANFADWFNASATFNGVNVTSPATPWVPYSITIMYY
jgi:hypothetical protein